jgi:hypothetical protein
MRSSNESPYAKLSTVATFPTNYFLENLAVRGDNSVLVSVLNQNELWFVPASNYGQPVESQLLFTFPHPAMGIVEVDPDVFYVSVSDIYTWKESYLYRLDLNGWKPGRAVRPESVLRFPDPIRGLNGSCVLAPGVMLLADSWAGLIWRVDLHVDGKPKPSVWLEHASMGYVPTLYYDRIQLPGVNGIQYSPKLGYVYYTATAQQLFVRVRVDPISFNPVGDVEIVASGRFDDFWIDQDAGFAYLARHTPNMIGRLALDPRENGSEIPNIAGDPFADELVGPSAGHWGRGREEYGRVAFVTTDGGTATPPPGGPRPAKVIKAEFRMDSAAS